MYQHCQAVEYLIVLYLSCLYSIHALTHIVIVSDSPNSGCKGEYRLYFEKIQSAESFVKKIRRAESFCAIEQFSYQAELLPIHTHLTDPRHVSKQGWTRFPRNPTNQ